MKLLRAHRALDPEGSLWAIGRFVNNPIASRLRSAKKEPMTDMKHNPPGGKRRRRYDDEFKRRAVELSEKSDRTIGEVARELGVGEDLLYAWRREYGVAKRQGVPMPTGPRSVTELERENHELRIKLAEMQNREAILKKSLGILSEAPGSGMPKWKR